MEDTDFRSIGEGGTDEQPIDTSFEIGPSMDGRPLPNRYTLVMISVAGQRVTKALRRPGAASTRVGVGP